MLHTDIIPIVFSSDDFFVPYMATMMQSVMENSNQSKRYHFFILHVNISSINMELLKKQVQNYQNFSLDFISVTDFIQGYDFYTANRNSITIETYFRLLIPDLFSEYEKIVYLDGDMICCADVADLYHVDVSNYLLASSRDTGNIGDYHRPESRKRRQYNDEVLKLSIPDNYFIAGMLVMNIVAFRKQFTVKELLDFAVSRKWRAHDQDILNVLCQGKTLLLPIEWDFTWDDDSAAFLPETLKKEYDTTKKNPKIVHFPGERKPWLNAVNVPYFEVFWKYATRTPFTGVILDRMNEAGLTGLTYKDRILSDIKGRQKLGVRFIAKCFAARFLKDIGISKD